MKYLFIDQEFKYDGTQLKPLFAYLNYKILGDSIVSWVGPCDIPFEHMVDGEDVLAQSEIRGDKMLHFIVEKFDVQLFAGVALQRLLASIVIDILRDLSLDKSQTQKLVRDGDDIFLANKKLSISIATQSINSTLVHFAVNVVNTGTPVETLSLNDLKIDVVMFAHRVLEKFTQEVGSIIEATHKVRTLG